MLRITVENVQIYTSQPPYADTSFFRHAEDKSKPYLRLKIKVGVEIPNFFKRVCIYGTLSEVNGKITNTIIGARNVMRALDELEDEIAPIDSLTLLRDKCRLIVDRKALLPVVLPSGSKQKKDFVILKKISDDNRDNPCYLAHKTNHPEALYILKEDPTKRSISDYEAANSACYRLLMNDRHPKTKSVYDDKKRWGTASKFIEGFESFLEKQENAAREGKKYLLTPEDILKAEIVKVLVPAYTEEEMDLHYGNYGTRKDGISVKIDDDQATWPLVSKYFCFDPDHLYPPSFLQNEEVGIPALAFQVTEKDIRDLANLMFAKPNFWPQENEIFIGWNALSKNEKFNDDKYFMFLKRIVIPDSVYEAIARANFKSEKKRNAFAKHKCKKTVALHTVLLQMPEFQAYLQGPDILDKLLREFEQYNQYLKKEKNRDLRVDLNVIKQNFLMIKATADQHIESKNKQKQIALNRSILRRHPYSLSPLLRDVLIGVGAGLIVVLAIFATVASVGVFMPALGVTITALFAQNSFAAIAITALPLVLPFYTGILGKIIRTCSVGKKSITSSPTEAQQVQRDLLIGVVIGLLALSAIALTVATLGMFMPALGVTLIGLGTFATSSIAGNAMLALPVILAAGAAFVGKLVRIFKEEDHAEPQVNAKSPHIPIAPVINKKSTVSISPLPSLAISSPYSSAKKHSSNSLKI